MIDLKKIKEDIDNSWSEITNKISQYNDIFYNSLVEFVVDNNLENDVIRTVGDRSERGRLKIIRSEYKFKRSITAYVQFYPYKKNGELGNTRRSDDISIHDNPSEYFDMLKKIYKPAE